MNPLKVLGRLVLPVAGRLLKGKLTNAGLVTAAVGLGVDVAQGHDVFDSLRAVVDLAEQGWPHVLVIVGALTALAGWFRKAGWAAAQAQSSGK